MRTTMDPSNRSAILCFSHLRWEFVWQRPQHLLSRAAAEYDVFFLEEAIRCPVELPFLKKIPVADGIEVLQLHVPLQMPELEVEALLKAAAQGAVSGRSRVILWFYTPMALPWSDGLDAAFVVYDCMDDLAGFRGASPDMKRREHELMGFADLVLTGGVSLFEARRGRHHNLHLFPSSVDAAHFAKARQTSIEPHDQVKIPAPRIGYFGVIDERLDYSLIAKLAALKPEWQLVLLGPTAKIDASELPRASNIHWLGQKPYEELPDYLRGWSAGFMPFALNEATRYISPTKTPEFLAAGLPVVSTEIKDVERAYGDVVAIASDADGFADALDKAMRGSDAAWKSAVDTKLASQSWDRTWADIARLLPCQTVQRELQHV